MNNKEITNFLKCVAILVVCGNHFVNYAISKNFMGYANGFISIFFVLSGYGIYLSFEKFEKQTFPSLLSNFFKKRVLRIYPLFWLWCIRHGFSNGLLGFFALDFLTPKSPWFIPAILQCYMISIPLYYFGKHVKKEYQFGIVFCTFILGNLFLFWGDYSPIQTIGYKGVFFLHIFLFYLGFILAIMKPQPNTFHHSFFSIISVVFFLFCIQETTPQAFFNFHGDGTLFAILLSFSTLLLCYTFLRTKFSFSFKATNFIGSYTYSIYLFHGISHTVLSKSGIIQANNTGISGAMIWLLTLPLFILLCAAIETAMNEIIFGRRRPRDAINSYLKSMKIGN